MKEILCCKHDALNCLLANSHHCGLRPINLQKWDWKEAAKSSCSYKNREAHQIMFTRETKGQWAIMSSLNKSPLRTPHRVRMGKAFKEIEAQGLCFQLLMRYSKYLKKHSSLQQIHPLWSPQFSLTPEQYKWNKHVSDKQYKKMNQNVEVQWISESFFILLKTKKVMEFMLYSTWTPKSI